MQAQVDNIKDLHERLQAPLLADIPHSTPPQASAIAIELPPAWRTAW